MELQFFSLATTFSLDRFVWYYIILQYDALYNDGVVWCIQWNLSNQDTSGAGESVIVSEVSSFQRLKCMQEVLGVGKGVLFREVSPLQD